MRPLPAGFSEEALARTRVDVGAEWTMTISKHTECLVWHGKVQECQRCGIHLSINTTDGILNASRNTSITRVGDVTRDPQIGTEEKFKFKRLKTTKKYLWLAFRYRC